MMKNYTVGLTGETVSVNPRCWKIFKRVPRLGVVLHDSILATEDCGRPHMAASSRWLRPSAFRCSTMAVTIAATSSVSLMSFAVSGSTVRTYAEKFTSASLICKAFYGKMEAQ